MEGKEKIPDREDRYIEEQKYEITMNLHGIKSKFIYSVQIPCGQNSKRDVQDRRLERLQGSQYKWSNI